MWKRSLKLMTGQLEVSHKSVLKLCVMNTFLVSYDVEKISNFQRFWYLNIPCLRINVTFTFMSSSSDELTHLQKHSKTAVSVGFLRPYLCPSKRHQHSVSIQSLLYWVKRFSEYLAQMSRNNLQQLYFISKPLLYNKIEHNPQAAKALEAGCVNIHVNK